MLIKSTVEMKYIEANDISRQLNRTRITHIHSGRRVVSLSRSNNTQGEEKTE